MISQERIAASVEVADCWLWQLHIDRDGYGKVKVDGRTESAHRAVWMSLVGPIEPGITLDHLCRVRACVNPDHLEPVTNLENIRRARRKVCRSGRHLLTGERRCRECKREYERNQKRKIKGARA